MILTFCGCDLGFFILVCIHMIRSTLKKNLRHPGDYKRHHIYIGFLRFTHRKSIVYLIINRMFTIYCLGKPRYIKERTNLYVESSNLRSLCHLKNICNQGIIYIKDNRVIDMLRGSYSIIKLWFKLYLELINFNNAL